MKVVADNVVAIAAGGGYNTGVSGHSLVVKKDGSLWGTGAKPNQTLTLNPKPKLTLKPGAESLPKRHTLTLPLTLNPNSNAK